MNNDRNTCNEYKQLNFKQHCFKNWITSLITLQSRHYVLRKCCKAACSLNYTKALKKSSYKSWAKWPDVNLALAS